MADKDEPLPRYDAYAEGLKSSYYLGDSDNHKRLLVTFPSHGLLSGKDKALTIIHTGPNESEPRLAYLTKKGTFAENTTVHVPDGRGGEVAVYFRTNCSFGGGHKNIIHRFSMDLGSTKRTEDFEWRMATKGVVKNYGNYGFVLYHMREGGEEIVAVLGLGKSSLTKKFTWTLLSDGATGIFGPEWEIVALATAIRADKLELDRLVSTA